MTTSSATLTRAPLSPLLRVLLMVFVVLTLLAVIALLVRAEHTDEGFAWTIAPPLAAAFLGAGYGAGCLLVALSLRGASWEQARWPLWSVVLFVTLTLVATLVHLDRLHLPGTSALATSAAWFWLVVYVALPPGLAIGLLREDRIQRRSRAAEVSQADAPKSQPRLFTGFLLAQGVLLGVTGVALFLVSSPVLERWPWALTAFVSRVTGAWLLAFALAAFLGARVDAALLSPATVGYAAFGALELLAVALHTEDLRSGASSVVYVGGAVWVVVTGAWGAWLGRRGP